MTQKNKRKKYIKHSLLVILFLYIFTGLYHSYVKPLPQGINMQGEIHNIKPFQVTFLHDETYRTESGEQVINQEIFDVILSQIESASSYILLDMFFFSDFTGTEKSSYRALSGELTDALITKKKSSPDITIQVITDSINTMYEGHRAEHLERLQANNIPVIITDVSKLRDSNPLYSPIWRWIIGWFGNTQEGGWIQNAMDIYKPQLTLRSYLHALNYKANHRKVLVTDSEEKQLITLITSANPHDGSSKHSNVAFQIYGDIGWDVITSEQAVANISGDSFKLPNFSKEETKSLSGAVNTINAQLLTEKRIKDNIITNISNHQKGDSIDILMFYFSERDIINALIKASKRDVGIRVLMDPNKDAFGRTKDGTPNRQVAGELHENGIEVRWCNTHGEQCHGKLLLFSRQDKKSVMLGSANLTRRNISNYNLESNIILSGDSEFSSYRDASNLFNDLWNNTNGNIYSLDYENYKNESTFDYVKYWLKEMSGFSRF